MKLSKITQKSLNKYELIIDNKKHVIYDDVLLKYNLLKPREITKEEYEEIIKYNDTQNYYSKIINFISYKMRSEKEVLEKLASLGASKEVIDDLDIRLLKEGYIDNKRYMESFIKDEMHLTLDGPDKIVSKLCKKGFSINSIYKYLENIPYEEWKTRCDKIVDKRLKNSKNGSKRAILGRIRAYLLSEGYKEDHFSDILENVTINDSDSLKKEYEKLKVKLAKKYPEEKLDYYIKQKLYAKGYDTRKL